MITRAAIYLRVSTDGQATKGFGLDVQLIKCQAQAVVKGWEVTAVYTDEGLSGTISEGDRPGLTEIIAAAHNGEIDAVIVSALDRLGRNTRLVLRLVDEFTKCDVSVISCRETLDTSTAAGKFVLTMFAALAQLERDNIVERTTAGRNARGKVDGERGGRVPYGYSRTAVGITINDIQADTVTNIFRLRKLGLSLRKIADSINETGVMSSRNKSWNGSSIRWVLANDEKYAGGRRGESDYRWPVILAG